MDRGLPLGRSVSGGSDHDLDRSGMSSSSSMRAAAASPPCPSLGSICPSPFFSLREPASPQLQRHLSLPPQERFTFLREIGSGSFGAVYLAIEQQPPPPLPLLLHATTASTTGTCSSSSTSSFSGDDADGGGKRQQQQRRRRRRRAREMAELGPDAEDSLPAEEASEILVESMSPGGAQRLRLRQQQRQRRWEEEEGEGDAGYEEDDEGEEWEEGYDEEEWEDGEGPLAVRAVARRVAVKVIGLEDQDEEMGEIQREIAVLSECSCPQLTRYYGSYVVGNSLWIAMEYLEGGSLGELMELAGGQLAEPVVAHAVRELCRALAYLHGERKIHRDVKAKNVLVSRRGDVKLADFGATAQLTETMGKRQTFAGTPFWMAPEVITQTSYDAKADIWSVGITAIELAKGQPPYATTHPVKALFLIPKNPPPRLEEDDDDEQEGGQTTEASAAFALSGEEEEEGGRMRSGAGGAAPTRQLQQQGQDKEEKEKGSRRRFSGEFKAFVAQCLAKDPAERPTAAELTRCAFLSNEAVQAEGRAGLMTLVKMRLAHQRRQQALAQEAAACEARRQRDAEADEALLLHAAAGNMSLTADSEHEESPCLAATSSSSMLQQEQQQRRGNEEGEGEEEDGADVSRKQQQQQQQSLSLNLAEMDGGHQHAPRQHPHHAMLRPLSRGSSCSSISGDDRPHHDPTSLPPTPQHGAAAAAVGWHRPRRRPPPSHAQAQAQRQIQWQEEEEQEEDDLLPAAPAIASLPPHLKLTRQYSEGAASSSASSVASAITLPGGLHIHGTKQQPQQQPQQRHGQRPRRGPPGHSHKQSGSSLSSAPPFFGSVDMGEEDEEEVHWDFSVHGAKDLEALMATAPPSAADGAGALRDETPRDARESESDGAR